MNAARLKPDVTTKARSLRSNMADAEKLLWRALRSKQLKGLRFRRQHPVGKYIADFACIERHVIIELDGGQHQKQMEYDKQRTASLQGQGWQVIRFWNNEVLHNLDGVLFRIAEHLETAPHIEATRPIPSPLQGEG